MNRRDFLHTAGAAAAGAFFMRPPLSRAEDKSGVRWPIGCFNRPWARWGFNDALDGIKAAGYRLTGLLSRSQTEPFISAAATPEYLDELKRRLAERGLRANMGALNVSTGLPLVDATHDLRKQIDNAKSLNLDYVLTFGVNDAAANETFYCVMGDGAAYAQERGIQLVMKPHGGASGASEEILCCISLVGHPNFKIWYDAGNIIYYTGKDPLEELKPIAKHVTGFCAKDCGKPKGDVMIQFGTGKVDFKAVFGHLKSAGFNGPVMVECCAQGPSFDQITANARANREFLEKLFATL